MTAESFTPLWITPRSALGDRLLADIDADGLEAELEALIGPRYLAFVRRADGAYAEALRITAAGEVAEAGVCEPLRRVQVAIQQYVFALFAEHRPSYPANHKLLRQAFALIDAHRAAHARRSPPPAPERVIEPEPIGPPPDETIPCAVSVPAGELSTAFVSRATGPRRVRSPS